MKLNRLQLFYLAMAAAGLIGTTAVLLRYVQNYGLNAAEFISDAVASHGAVYMLVELTVLTCAYLPWMWYEADRLRISQRWRFVALTFLPSPAVSLPLFLFARSRRLQNTDAARRTPDDTDLLVSSPKR